MRRSLAAIGLLIPVSSACACAPWPPPPSSCVEVTPARRHTATQYAVRGQRVSREDVERIIRLSPEAKHRIEARRALVVPLAIGGAGLFAIGSVMVAATKVLPLVALPALGYSVAWASWGISLETDEPFHDAVRAFNRAHEGVGSCVDVDMKVPSQP